MQMLSQLSYRPVPSVNSSNLPAASIGFVRSTADAQSSGYEIRRSTRARRSRLTITDDGRAVVVLPLRAREAEAADLVTRHRAWIARHVARIAARQSALAGRPPLDGGRSIAIAGAPHRLIVTTTLHGRRSSVRQEPGLMIVERAAAERRSTAALLEAWLRAYARDVIAERVGRRAVEMDLEVQRITIRDQRTRWGSASHNGTLSFNWRLVMSPPGIIDYVVVHELAHLRHSGHGRRFWRLVRPPLPGQRGCTALAAAQPRRAAARAGLTERFREKWWR